MKRKFLTSLTHFFLIFALTFGNSSIAVAQQFEEFIVEDIRLEGLRRFSPGIVFSRLPIAIGDEFTEELSIDVIESLYDTGFFRVVEVLRDDNVLVIKVEENPIIAEVTISGASELPDSALSTMLEEAGITKSQVFNRGLMEEAAKVIEDIYVEKNFYHAKVEAVVSPLPRNRVAILFNIDEGSEASIRFIQIIGNEVFSDWKLSQDMRLEPKGILNFFTDNYRFSESKLGADLARIRTRYLKEGYLRFKVEAKQVEVSSDKEHIDIIIRINEGQQFSISKITLKQIENSPILPFVIEDEFQPHIDQEEGDIYSGRASGETITKIKSNLSNLGYFNADVLLETDIDDETGEVALTYIIDPRNIVFVREINIVGNEITDDEIIRRELLIFEQERYSGKKISRSRSRIRRLGYFDNVVIDSIPVPDDPDKVDLLVEVSEASTGNFKVGAGFSTDGGISFNTGFTSKNVVGSGNDLDVQYAHGKVLKRFNFALDEHYYTKDGVSRHLAIDYGETDSGENSSNYSIDGYKGEYGYVFPFTDDGKYNIYVAYQQVKVNNTSSLNSVYQRFIDKYSDSFDTIMLLPGFKYDTRDAALTPTEGYKIDINSEIALPLLDLKYYHIDYQQDYYYTIRNIPTEPIMHLRLGYGYGGTYGDDEYPFYRRYHLGGTKTLRGLKADSVGYTIDTSNNSIGGKSRLYASAEWSTDVEFFETQQVFFVPFIDIGAVGKEFGLGSFRASWGVEIRWVSPVGPLRFSYIELLKSKAEDDVEKFQFSVSTF